MHQHRAAESKLKIATWFVASLLTIVGGAAIGSSFQRTGQATGAAAGPTPFTANGAPAASSAPPTMATTTTLSGTSVAPPSTATPPVIPGFRATSGAQPKGHAGRSHHNRRAKGQDD
jgi:hypothetical protein